MLSRSSILLVCSTSVLFAQQIGSVGDWPDWRGPDRNGTSREKGLPDKWVQFGVPDPGTSAPVRNVSVVSTTVNADGTFNAYFKDFYRTYLRNGSIKINGRWELGEGDNNCVQCHKSGVLPIFPAHSSVKPEEQQAAWQFHGDPRSFCLCLSAAAGEGDWRGNDRRSWWRPAARPLRKQRKTFHLRALPISLGRLTVVPCGRSVYRGSYL